MTEVFRVALISIACLVLVSCSAAEPDPDWQSINDFLFQLQRANPDRWADAYQCWL